MSTVSAESVAAGEAPVEGLPERVQVALGELAGAAREGLLALSVGVGLGVLHEIMEAEVDDVVGPRGRHDRDRAAVRHGHEGGAVTLGGRRVPVRRPRARTADGSEEVELQTYRHFAARDQLADVMLERMLAGVSTRRYARTGEPVGTEVEVARSTSKSAVSREFVSRTREHLIALMSRPLADLRLAVLMLDGIELKGRCCVVALAIDTDGIKHRSACGTAPRRTPPSRQPCWPTSSSAASMSTKASWSCSTAPTRSERPSATCSVNRPGWRGEFWPWKRGRSYGDGEERWEVDEQAVFG
jgi:hypothetical protein